MKGRIGFGPVAAFIMSVPLAMPSFAEDGYQDDFRGGIHNGYWQTITNCGLYEVDDSNDNVRFSKDYGGDYSLQIIELDFPWEVRGDFDVSVDFYDAMIDRIDGSPGNQIQLNTMFGSQVFCVVRSQEVDILQGLHNHHVWTHPPGNVHGEQPNAATSGTLRIVRTGSVVTGYFDDTQIWSGDYSSSPVTKLWCSLHNNGTKDATSVTFDNFHLTADEIVITFCTLSIDTVNDAWGDVGFSPEPNDANMPIYPEGTEVTLTATPIEGKSFNHWKLYDANFPGDANYAAIDSNNPITIEMMDDREVTAVFKCGGSMGQLLPIMLGVLGMLLVVKKRRR